MLELALIENVQREDLSPIEEANAYQRLNEEFNLTHAQISDIVGKDRVTITNLIRLLKLPASIQKMILKEQLSPGHARAILQVAEEDQENFANMIVSNIFSVRKAEQEAKLIKEKVISSKPKTEPVIIPELQLFEKKLKNDYQARIKISGKLTKGKISFYYSSKKELERLINKFENNE